MVAAVGVDAATMSMSRVPALSLTGPGAVPTGSGGSGAPSGGGGGGRRASSLTAARRASLMGGVASTAGGLGSPAPAPLVTAEERFTRDAIRRTHNSSLIMFTASVVLFACFGAWARVTPAVYGGAVWSVGVNALATLVCAGLQVAVAHRYRARALHPIATWLPGISMLALTAVILVTGFAEAGGEFEALDEGSWMPVWCILAVFPIAFAMSAIVYAVAAATIVVVTSLAFTLLHALGVRVGVADAVSIALIVVFACAGFGAQRAANALVLRSIDQVCARRPVCCRASPLCPVGARACLCIFDNVFVCEYYKHAYLFARLSGSWIAFVCHCVTVSLCFCARAAGDGPR